jgi:hypothetical protein
MQDKLRFVSVTGTAHVVADRALVGEVPGACPFWEMLMTRTMTEAKCAAQNEA